MVRPDGTDLARALNWSWIALGSFPEKGKHASHLGP